MGHPCPRCHAVRFVARGRASPEGCRQRGQCCLAPALPGLSAPEPGRRAACLGACPKATHCSATGAGTAGLQDPPLPLPNPSSPPVPQAALPLCAASSSSRGLKALGCPQPKAHLAAAPVFPHSNSIPLRAARPRGALLKAPHPRGRRSPQHRSTWHQQSFDLAAPDPSGCAPKISRWAQRCEERAALGRGFPAGPRGALPAPASLQGSCRAPAPGQHPSQVF